LQSFALVYVVDLAIVGYQCTSTTVGIHLSKIKACRQNCHNWYFVGLGELSL
jgi:hypothetical protein